jgi:hypothetical protein
LADAEVSDEGAVERMFNRVLGDAACITRAVSRAARWRRQ